MRLFAASLFVVSHCTWPVQGLTRLPLRFYRVGNLWSGFACRSWMELCMVEMYWPQLADGQSVEMADD